MQAENDYRLSLLDVSQLLELPSPDNFRIVSPDIQPEQLFGTLTPPAEIYSQALLTKPSIKAAQYRLEGAARSIRIAQSAYYPQLNFGAGLGTRYYNYYCPIKILQSHKIRADFICEVSPFSLDFSRQTIKSNHGQKYTF